MKDALKKVVVAAGLAFTGAAPVMFTPTEAEACKITMYAKSRTDPLQNLPPQYQKHSKTWFWQSFEYKLAGNSSFGRHKVGTDFRSAARACERFVNEYIVGKNAAKASWEMVCKLDRVNQMSPEARKKWTGQVEEYCTSVRPLRVR